MVKYDVTFKLKIVEAYLANEGGYKYLAEKLGIPSKESIRLWMKTYSKYGIKGLEKKHKHKNYPVQFKVDIINYKLRTGDSLSNIALNFDIPEPSVIHYRYKT